MPVVLEGDLTHFFPSEVLQLLQLAQAQGRLEFARAGEQVDLWIDRGRPVFAPSTLVLAKLAKALGGRVALIGVGGILSGADAKVKIDAGASLVQVYTGFIYRGPDVIAAARRALR